MKADGRNSAKDNRLRRDPRGEVGAEWWGAVLLRDKIRHYATEVQPPLIDPFNEDHLEPASYHLCLGSECRCRVGGKGQELRNLSGEDPKLEIDKHDMAVVSTFERVNIPDNLIARWNLRVGLVYEGLIWVGGPQVDPGYRGHLYCPLYNFSNRKVELKYRDPIFTIDFVKTTPYRTDKGCTLWDRGDKPDSLGAHDIHRLQSAPSEDFRVMGEKIQRIQDETNRLQATVLIVLAIVVAAVAAIASLGVFGRFTGEHQLNWVSIGISVTAVAMAFVALLKSCIKKKE